MNAEVLKQAGIDYEQGVKRFVGRAHLYEKTLAKFVKDTTFSRISAAYEANDREELLLYAHEYKGMCGNISLTALYEASDAMVRLLRGDACTEEALADAYATLERAYRAAYEAVLAEREDPL